MRNYIHADMKRILGRVSHAFSILLLMAIHVMLMVLPNRNAQVTSVSLINSACSNLGMLIVLFGLFEMIAVFAEDFKVKTMQVAIGLGLSRTKVVVCKLIEFTLLMLLDAFVLTLLTMGSGALLNVSIPFAVLKDLIHMLLVQGVFAATIFTALTMIVMFTTHSSILSIFTYVLVAIDLLGTVLSLLPLLGVNALEPLNLNRFTLSHLINVFDARLALGSFDFMSFLGLMIYMAVGVVVTCKLFAKRELDF